MRQMASLACAALLLALAPAAAARDYQAATFLPPSHLLTAGPLIEWSKDISAATNGRLRFNVHAGGALLGPTTMMAGLGEDVAQIGFVAASYYPKDFPKTNTIDDLSFIHTEPLSLAFAFTEFVMATPEIRKEWEDNNLVFIAGMSTPPYQLFCRSEMRTAADLRGKKVRTPNAVLTRWAQAVGVIPINAPFSEIYIGLERGALDCAAADNTTLTSARLLEVTRHVMELDLGSYFLGSPWSLSRSFWKELSAEDRQILLDVTARSLVRLQLTYARSLQSSVDQAKAAGVTFTAASDELEAARTAFIAADMGGSAELSKTQLGVKDPARHRDRLTALVEKWKTLLQTTDRSDENALLALLRAEIYDSVDVRTYGLK